MKSSSSTKEQNKEKYKQFMENLIKILNFFKRFIYHPLTKQSTLFISSLAFIFLLWISVSLTFVYFQITTDQNPISIMDTTVTAIMNLFGISENNKKEMLTELINIYLGFSGVLLSGFTFVSYLKKKRDLKKSLPIISYPVFEVGYDDIAVMSRYYQNSSEITVFSGTFSWIFNEKIFKKFYRLAECETLYLFTSRDLDKVKQTLRKECTKNHSAQLETILNRLYKFTKSGDELKCSFVKRNNTTYLIYKHETHSENGTLNQNVHVLREKDGGEYLLRAFGIIINNIEENSKLTTTISTS